MLTLITKPDPHSSIGGYNTIITFKCVCGEEQSGWPEFIFGQSVKFVARCKLCSAVLPKVQVLATKQTVRLQYHIDTIVRENASY